MFVDELHLFFLPVFCGQFGLGEPASASLVALDMPMNCSSRISNLENFFLLAHVVDFSPGCSDSLSLHFHLDDLDLHCIFDSLVQLGLFLRSHLEDFGLLYLHWVHGWLDTCVRNLFTGPLLDPVLRFFPTAECRNCASSWIQSDSPAK